jgi:PilZ domain
MIDGLLQALKVLRTSQDEHLVERRGHYRLPCRRSVHVFLPREVLGGHMINLGPSGMRIRTTKKIPVNTQMRLVVSGKRSSSQRFAASIDLICRTIWCKHSVVHDEYNVGLEYVPAPGVDLEYVDAFFRHELGLEDVETYQRRISRRISTELDVTCWTPDGAATRGSVRDLSLHGAQFDTSAEVPTGSEVRLAIEVAGRSTPIYCVCRVARCKPTAREGWFDLGVAFIEMLPKDEEALRRTLAKAAAGIDET